MLFYQLFEAESSTFTYLMADESTKEAIIIDPVIETSDRDLKLIKELNLKLLYSIETHIHADHVTGAHKIKLNTNCKTVVSKYANVSCADLKVGDGDILSFGKYQLKVLETKGHTDSCLSLYMDGMIFTGDLLFIRGTGRTDFQQGDSRKMFQNIREKVFSLPDETKIYPGHDYKGMTHSTVWEEKNFNPRVALSKSEDDFVKIMSELKLAHPKKIDVAVPANLVCGNING